MAEEPPINELMLRILKSVQMQLAVVAVNDMGFNYLESQRDGRRYHN
jgi:hypothetical protein